MDVDECLDALSKICSHKTLVPSSMKTLLGHNPSSFALVGTPQATTRKEKICGSIFAVKQFALREQFEAQKAGLQTVAQMAH